MIDPFPQEADLITFFSSPPILLDRNMPWCYNMLTFVYKQNDERLTCEITPPYKKVSILHSKSGKIINDIQLQDVISIQIQSNGVMHVACKEGALRLGLSPSIKIQSDTRP